MWHELYLTADRLRSPCPDTKVFRICARAPLGRMRWHGLGNPKRGCKTKNCAWEDMNVECVMEMGGCNWTSSPGRSWMPVGGVEGQTFVCRMAAEATTEERRAGNK